MGFTVAHKNALIPKQFLRLSVQKDKKRCFFIVYYYLNRKFSIFSSLVVVRLYKYSHGVASGQLMSIYPSKGRNGQRFICGPAASDWAHTHQGNHLRRVLVHTAMCTPPLGRCSQIWPRHSHLPPTFIDSVQMDSDGF